MPKSMPNIARNTSKNTISEIKALTHTIHTTRWRFASGEWEMYFCKSQTHIGRFEKIEMTKKIEMIKKIETIKKLKR